MNILFINPSSSRLFGRKSTWESALLNTMFGKKTAMIPKLAGMVLAALTPERHVFTYVEDELEEVDFDADVDLAAITVLTEQAFRAYQIAGEFKKRGKTVVMGGIHAAVMTDEVALHCDAAMVGEGESTWPALLEDFENGCLKKLYDASDYPPVDNLVSPKVSIINLENYIMFPIQATRGCPYDCDFCSIEYSSGHKYKMKPVEQVVAEILEYERQADSIMGLVRKGYYFVDDNLYVNREYVKELLTALIPLGITWEAQGTMNTAKDEEILSLMAESGCRSFSIGFESINPESLKEANKPQVNVIEEYNSCITAIAKHGIIPTGFFVFGFDHDNVEVFQSTLEFIRNSDMVTGVFNLLTPYPGTRLYDRIKPRIFNTASMFYDAWTCVFTPKSMSASDLQRGSRWIAAQMADFEFTWNQLKKFWDYGPWKTKETLSFKHRATLVYIGIRLGLHRMYKQQKFIFRCAFHKNATEFREIVWALRRYEMTNNPIWISENPALDKARS